MKSTKECAPIAVNKLIFLDIRAKGNPKSNERITTLIISIEKELCSNTCGRTIMK
jgi:hypothetical protein